MECIAREMIIPCTNGRPVFPAFITYISPAEPHLLWRSGWEDFSDGYDDFADRFSYDNGGAWTEPVVKLKKTARPDGDVRYAENAAFFDADTGKLLTFVSRGWYPKDHIDVDTPFSVWWDIYDPAAQKWTGLRETGLQLPGGVAISFCFPIKLRSGRLLIPAMTQMRGADGKPIHYNNCWAPAHQSMIFWADYDDQGGLRFELGGMVQPDLALSSRGFDENTVAELPDGRLAMVIRGSNDTIPEKMGVKWAAFSPDQGRTWGPPAPWRYDDGEPVESSATGSALFRAAATGKLYWLGNACQPGQKAQGNWPRWPLVIGAVDEDSFTLQRRTLATIDTRRPGEPEQVQHSNFRFYEDRDRGELVVLLTRYGERSAEQWMNADHYRYRVRLD